MAVTGSPSAAVGAADQRAGAEGPVGRDRLAASDVSGGTVSRRAGFRPEVQALRAVAVMLVVVFHLWPQRLHGGFAGVDVFFVISGFLITDHLTRELADTGRIRLPAFYARRARRLLPAALTVLLASAVGVFVMLPITLWERSFRELAASALYVENWSLARSSVSYFAAEDAPTVAQHFWSLSVEEQFYLGWPLIFLLIAVIADRIRTEAASRRLVLCAGPALVLVFSFGWSALHH
jgi:peptidoglycan/LPS O-acetylase OafA/YrhL